jgi:two-component system, NtrC family, sensor kinase
LLLMELIEKYSFERMKPRVVAVADKREDAPGVILAKKRGIFVAKDYNELFSMDDIDLIIELAGSEEIFFDILEKKKKTVRAFNHKTAELFWEVSRASHSQQKTEQELEKTRTMYNVFINELIQENVMIISPSYEILDVNETLLKRQGLTRGEVIGRTCFEISHHRNTPCEGENHPCPLIETSQTKKPSQTTHIHLDKDGRELFYSISCYPIFEKGEIVSLVEVSRDITKDINLQKMMMQQEKLASIGRLAAGVAHEINNPMTTILTTAMLIQEDLPPGDPNYRELQTIGEETLRCRKIVKSLLDFARQTRPERKPNDMNEIIRESVALTRKQAAFKDVAIEANLSAGMPLVDLDKDQIQQSLINLILNAVEATDPGGNIFLTSRLLPSEDAVEIGVADTGRGIADSDLDKIFEPFFTTKETGTGLGLAITHGIIERHGGTIGFESESGKGTKFTIRLPIVRGEKDAY